MPIRRIKLDRLQSIVIPVIVLCPSSGLDATVDALIDTGATRSGINRSLIERLQCPPTGRFARIVQTYSEGEKRSDTYSVGLVLPATGDGLEVPPMDCTPTEVPAGFPEFIVGMDVLASFVLMYDGITKSAFLAW